MHREIDFQRTNANFSIICFSICCTALRSGMKCGKMQGRKDPCCSPAAFTGHLSLAAGTALSVQLPIARGISARGSQSDFGTAREFWGIAAPSEPDTTALCRLSGVSSSYFFVHKGRTSSESSWHLHFSSSDSDFCYDPKGANLVNHMLTSFLCNSVAVFVCLFSQKNPNNKQTKHTH